MSISRFTGALGRLTRSLFWPRSKRLCKLFAVGVISAGFSTSCGLVGGTGETVPANFPEAANVRSVAVMEFGGKNSAEIAAALESALVSHAVNNTPYYNVTQLSAANRLSSHRGEVTSATACDFGQEIGVQGVFFGRVNSYGVDSHNYAGKQYKCIVRNASGGCHKSDWVKATCTNVTASVAVLPKLVNVSTGQVVYARERTGTSVSSYCGDESQSEADNVLLARARDRAISSVIDDVAPHQKRVADYMRDAINSILPR